jgi:phosphate transport system protein
MDSNITASPLRQHYHGQIDEIRSDVVRMGNVASDMVRLAVEAVLNGDIELARTVVRMDDEVDNLEKDTVHKTVLTVMRESPVAGDLRLLVSTLGVVGEIENVADDAVKLARRVNKLTGHFPAEMKAALVELGEHARLCFASALRLYIEYTPELAREVVEADEEIDSRFAQARDRVLALIRQDPNSTEHLVRTISAFHALEHVADRAVEIANRLRLHYETPGAAESS